MAGVVSLLKQKLGLDKTMQVSFDFTEQTEIVKREKRKPLKQDKTGNVRLKLL